MSDDRSVDSVPVLPVPEGASPEYEAASRVLPGGYGRSTFASAGPNPPFVERGEGCYVWDSKGRQLLDLNNNFTTLIHGNAHPAITAAAEEAIGKGASFGLPNAYETRHAEALLQRVPTGELVRYANSGTEAVMLAIRVARAFTGRRRVVFVQSAYHGSSDVALVSGGENSQRGLTPSVIADVSLGPLNDLEKLRALIEPDPESFAAVVLDFVANRSGLIPLTEEFVAGAAALCKEHGILLIADEVICFRLGERGLAAEYGVGPDLVTLGKLIGGGFPVGAVAGRAEVMAELDPLSERGLEHGGTFSGNPVTMAAGAVALDLYDAAEVQRLNALGDRVRTELAASLEPLGWEIRGRGSLFRPFRANAALADQRRWQGALWWNAYERGVLLTQNCMCTLSTPMDASEASIAIAGIVAAARATGSTRA